MAINRVAVVGAGVMGGAIAAHIANAGYPVLLLDVVPKDAADRNALAKAALARMEKAEPAPFMSTAARSLVTPGNTADDLKRLVMADWIIEAVSEDLAIKQALYRKIEDARAGGSIVSSNTSTLPLSKLMAGMPDRLAHDFVITHFFNPPRYMRLLEIVAGPKTWPETVAEISRFADEKLGKSVVIAKDTPGFVANRIGVFWMQAAIGAARDLGLSVEETDALMGPIIGLPKTGIFGLLDLVGLDLQPHVDGALAGALGPEDPYMRVRRDWPLLRRMIAEGLTGRKGKGGFYRLTKGADGSRTMEAIDLATGAYRPRTAPKLESLEAGRRDLKKLMRHPDTGGDYVRRVLGQTLSYAAGLVPQIADTIEAVDRAMRLGYSWKAGPFEMIDRLGAADLAGALAQSGEAVPPFLALAARQGGFYRIAGGRREMLTPGGDYIAVPTAPGILSLADIKLRSKPLMANGSASLWDIGDGVVCFEFHTKMNAIDPDILELLDRALEIVPKAHRAMVIANDGENFSAGANIGLALYVANLAEWPTIEAMVAAGQKAYSALRYAPFPVVGAVHGLALGGGAEILLHASAIQAHAETYMGLVECGVGLIPAWGGCKEMLARAFAQTKRARGPMPPIIALFETIAMAKVARSAEEARRLLYLRPGDAITMNRDRLLADAKARALALAPGYLPPKPVTLPLPGPTAKTALALALDGYRAKGLASPHDVRVGLALAEALSGGGHADITRATSEETIMGLERAGFMSLIATEPTLERMTHTLDTGKPLRN